MIASKPGVHGVVGCAGFTVQVGPLQCGLRPGGGARSGDLLQQLTHQKRIARINGTLRVFLLDGHELVQDLASVVGHFGDQIRIDPKPAIGKHRVAHRHLHGGDRSRAQSHGQVGRVALGLETKVGHPLLHVFSAHRLQDADRDHVFGFGQGASQAHGAIEFAVVVLGLPGLAAGDAGIKKQGAVVDDGAGGEPVFQRG